jgi:CheY-like chemotaxis protein
VQAAQPLARSEGGLGLGLALVKGLTELHGGTVEVTSAGTDQGATFTVRLPRIVEAPRAAPDLEAASPRSDRLRVLVVDDNHDAAESLADLVRMLGHDAEVAFDGWTAVQSALAAPPDLVLCDIGLPRLSGYEVAQALRSDPRLAHVHLIAVSGYAQAEDRKRALDAGFIDHIPKPADPARVVRALEDRSAVRSH